MRKITTFLCTALLAALCLHAGETKSWTHTSQADFENGTLKKVSLRSDGRLSIAPAFQELHDPSIAYLLALATDSKGNIFAGGGSPGDSAAKLITLDPSGKARVLAELPGLQIQAIAIDRNDRVYAATAPDGKVYRVSADGKSEVFYDPKAKYIWALAFSKAGDLFVATGDAGDIHRVRADGSGSVFFRTEETHARSLAIDPQDNLIVGTEPGGLILRVSPAGEGFVLYQAAKREVSAVAVNQFGMIYAAASGNRVTASTLPSTSVESLPIPPAQITPSAGAARAGAPPAIQPRPLTTAAPPPPGGGSEIYRIGPDGFPQRVWSHPTDTVYSIAFDAAGLPVVGTGTKGSIYRIDSEIAYTLLVDAAPSQVTALASGPGGRVYAATGNVGKIFRLGPDREKEGSYESAALDGGVFSYWGRIRQRGDLAGGTIRIETRSGNLDRPQKNWSPWAPIDPTSGRVTSPSARFLQYRATLALGNGSPEINEIEVAYMPKNVAPVIEQIQITPPNYKFPAASVLTTSTSTTSITLPPLGSRGRTTSSLSLDLTSGSSSQTMQYAKGMLGARWAVTDPNGDDMKYKIEIRGVNEREWKLIKDDVNDKFVGWESEGYADGEYILRVTATDLPDNPPDQAIRTMLDSERFVIDNSAPQILELTATRTGNQLAARWKARDGGSAIQQAQYSVNGSEWQVIQPTSRLSDSPEHDYQLKVDVTGTEHTLAVRVYDEFDNEAVAKFVVR